MASSTADRKEDTFPREIRSKLQHRAVRAYLTEDGLLVPVGYPGQLDWFVVPCPERPSNEEGHHCRMWRSDSRFECSCGDAAGDYWDYAGLWRGVDAATAYARVLEDMEIADLSEIGYPLEGQRWYDKKVGRLRDVPQWVALPSVSAIETAWIPPEEHPLARGDFHPTVMAKGEALKRRREEHKLAFRQARKLLCHFVIDCVREIGRGKQYTLFMYYRLGEIVYRLLELHRSEERRAKPGPYFDRLCGRLSGRGERYIQDARMIYDAVDFPWQLEPFRDVQHVRETIRSTRSPKTTLAWIRDGRLDLSLSFEQQFRPNVIPNGRLTVQLKDGEAAAAARRLCPAGSVNGNREVGEASLRIADKILAFCFKHPEHAECVAQLVEAVESTCLRCEDSFDLIVRRIAAGMRGLDRSREAAWLDHLPTIETA